MLLQIQFKTIVIIQIKNCLFKTNSNFRQDQNSLVSQFRKKQVQK
jgi:hypothetical protein